MSLFAELRRRNVFRVGAAYAVVAWVILQVTDTAAPALRLPEWVMSLVLFLLLLGFPIALFLAWAYELTPDGLRRAENTADAEAAASTGGKYDIAIIALLVVAIGLIVHDNYFSGADEVPATAPEPVADSAPAPAPAARTVSIAVIPFINMSDDPEQEHFADGLTEELLNSLAPIEQLRVISRTSSFAFKDSDLPLPEIASQLGVDHILEGSVRRAGNRIRITAQLIETPTDSHLWSNTYDEELTVENIFEVQESIASTVVNALQLRLLPSTVRSDLPSSLEALDLYHDGLFIFRQIATGQTLDEAKFSEAKAKFEGAIAIDPNWIEPVAMLGALYHFWSFGGRDMDKLAESRRLIESVLARDPGNPRALGSLAYILSREGRFQESLGAYERARQAGVPSVDWGRAITLMSLGRFDQAVTAYSYAFAHDPLNNTVRVQWAYAKQCAGRHTEIIAAEQELLELLGERGPVLAAIATSHAREGNRDAALRYLERLSTDSQDEALFALVFAILDIDARARRAIDELEARNAGLQTAAAAAVALGDDELGLRLLERLDQQEPAGSTLWLFCEPEIRNLAGNPRYDALLEKRGLSPIT